MKSGEYLSEKLREFTGRHYYQGYLTIPDRELERRWKAESANRDQKWRRIKSNRDVFDLIDRYDSAVSFVEEHVKVGHIEDAFNMALALHNALQGLRKLAQATDTPFPPDGFSPLSPEEIDAVFDRLERITERMDQENMKRAMAD